MKRKIGFSLVYRNMWQSSGKYQPKVEQLKEVAQHIIEMGCFDRIETHMLERALNGIRIYPVPADIRRLMFKVKRAQGVNI
jgi:pyruvate carboxylase subunit B